MVKKFVLSRPRHRKSQRISKLHYLFKSYAQTVRDSSSSYKIDYVIVIKNFLNPEGHQNPINGSKVTVILLKGWILPIGGASAVEGLRSMGLPHLVSVEFSLYEVLNYYFSKPFLLNKSNHCIGVYLYILCYILKHK